MKCFYHTDMDGKCAAAIVYDYFIVNKYSGKGHIDEVEEVRFIPINYKDDFPMGDILPGELVVIVDFSLQKPGAWQELFVRTTNVIWIDHHKTAIDKFPADCRKFLKGGIQSIDEAGCVLTWKYFYPALAIPKVVTLLGDYDTWAFRFGRMTDRLQAGIRLYETNPKDYNWQEWFQARSDLKDVIDAGAIALKYRDNYYQSLIKGWSFKVSFEGYKAICCNAGSVSSQLFDSVEEDYDLMMPFVFDGKQWTVSLYTKKKGIDVSSIAKKYGGGGHRQAAGFQCKTLPFLKKEKKK